MSEAPTHYCPIQGEGTEYQRMLNVKTNKYNWGCIWCEMAKMIGENAPATPSNTQGGGDE